MKRIPILALLALSLHACTYAISPEFAGTADKSVTFEKLSADPGSYKGKLVIFGGVIVQIRNTKEGTLIEVVQKDLDYWGKPKRTKASGGQFIVLTPARLDAIVYSAGREITVAAEVTGREQKTLSEAAYLYPLLSSKELKLWERARQSWDRPQWLDPLHDPYGAGGGTAY